MLDRRYSRRRRGDSKWRQAFYGKYVHETMKKISPMHHSSRISKPNECAALAALFMTQCAGAVTPVALYCKRVSKCSKWLKPEFVREGEGARPEACELGVSGHGALRSMVHSTTFICREWAFELDLHSVVRYRMAIVWL